MLKRELTKLGKWDVIGILWRDAHGSTDSGRSSELEAKPSKPVLRREAGFFLGYSEDGLDLLFTYVDDREAQTDADYEHLLQIPIGMIQTLTIYEKEKARK